MINDKRVIGVITARSGSKGLLGKNIRSLCGKPLIAWTIEKAMKSKYLDLVMVTTDSPEIANIANINFDSPNALDFDLAYEKIQGLLKY